MIAHLRNWWFFKHSISRLEEWTLNGIRLGTKGLNDNMKAVIVRDIYEAAEKVICKNVIRPGDRILELGGAIGYIGLHCLINCGAKSVVSVEANPETANRLRDNYRLNGREAVVIEAAVSDTDGPVEFSIGPDFWEDGLATSREGRRNISVPGRTFEKLLEQTEPAPNVLISDIEGAESIIRWSMIPLCIEKIVIELHPRQYGIGTTYRIIGGMIKAGFDVTDQCGDVFALQRSLSK